MIIPCCRKKEETPHCSAVIVAAGSSQRMGSDKLLHNLGIMPVLARTLLVFQDCELVDEIVVVTRMEKLEEVAELCKKYRIEKASKVICGGATRMESALAGVSEVKKKAKLIAIHDGARPLVSQALLDAVIARAEETGAAAPAVPVKDTIKRAVGHVVESTPDRSELFAVQTPQVFDADLIRGALARALEEGAELTDDCSAVERMGMKVSLTEGDYMNLKITTPEDMVLAEALLDWRERN